MKLLKCLFLTAILTVLCVVTTSAAWVAVGTVEADALRLREGPSTDTEILDTVAKGSQVLISDGGNGWYQVSFEGQEGYMSGDYLTVDTEKDGELGYGKVVTESSGLNVRSKATTDSGVLTAVPKGTILALEGFKDGWLKVTYKGATGYVSGDYVETTDETPENEATNAKDNVVLGNSSSLGARVVAEAKKHIGKPYRSGAKGPNAFDCSGFVYYVYKQFGYNFSGGSSTQWKTGPGKRVYSISELQPGDLFFINDPAYGSSKYPTSHVAIYAGNNQIIHASSSTTGVIQNTIKAKDIKYFVGGIHVG